jgi:hypothetical protein
LQFNRLGDLAVAIAACVVLAATSFAQQFKFTPALALPKLTNGTVELRVAYVANPRMPEITAHADDVLLTQAREAAREHLGADVRFTQLQQMTVEELFNRFRRRHGRR